MVVMDGFGKRIKLALERAGMNNAELARAIDVSPSTVGKWVHEESEVGKIEAQNLFDAAKVLRVDAEWLATGKGEPHPTPGSARITPEQASMLEAYDALSVQSRMTLAFLLDSLPRK